MDLYLVLKLVHVLLAIFAVGANLTYGFWMAMAGSDPDRIAFALRGIRAIDRAANMGYGLLLITGIALVLVASISFTTFWIAAAIVLYVGAVIFGIVLYAP